MHDPAERRGVGGQWVAITELSDVCAPPELVVRPCEVVFDSTGSSDPEECVDDPAMAITTDNLWMGLSVKGRRK